MRGSCIIRIHRLVDHYVGCDGLRYMTLNDESKHASPSPPLLNEHFD